VKSPDRVSNRESCMYAAGIVARTAPAPSRKVTDPDSSRGVSPRRRNGNTQDVAT
jgi:hypothetical protein